MAVVFLRTLGYKSAFNLSGGLSARERQGRPLEVSHQNAREDE
jgi:rhodanese-related sulfurtransferase